MGEAGSFSSKLPEPARPLDRAMPVSIYVRNISG
jgi:hypothetical protein